MQADVSIMPSMPMLTTPARSHHKPAMAPSATGVPSRSDSTRSCMTLVSCAGDRARDRMMTRGTKSTVETISAARARRSDRRSKNVATAHRTKMMPMAVTAIGGSTISFDGSGGGSKVRPTIHRVEVGRHVADEEQPHQAEDDPEGLPAPEAEARSRRPRPAAT